MTSCHRCNRKSLRRSNHSQNIDYEDVYDNSSGCKGLEATCTKSFPYPFTEFPIYILAGKSYLEAYEWKEIFPEAIIIFDFEQIKINLSNLGEGGALVIVATSTTPLCRDIFLNILTAAINITRIKGYRGFYIDNYFDSFPDKTAIADLSPRQAINIASLVKVNPALRSYWIGDFSKEFLLEGQLFPQLVNHIVLQSVEPPLNNFGLIIIIFFLILAFIFWFSIVVWY